MKYIISGTNRIDKNIHYIVEDLGKKDLQMTSIFKNEAFQFLSLKVARYFYRIAKYTNYSYIIDKKIETI